MAALRLIALCTTFASTSAQELVPAGSINGALKLQKPSEWRSKANGR